MVNKYEGPRSCYAAREGAYVPRIGGRGVTTKNIWSIAALILRDYQRGWSYDSECRRIQFSEKRARARLRFAKTLCMRFDRKNCRKIDYDPDELLRRGRLPRGVKVYLAGRNALEVAEDLARKGIVAEDQVELVTRSAVRTHV